MIDFTNRFIDYAIKNINDTDTFSDLGWISTMNPKEYVDHFKRNPKACREAFKMLVEDLGMNYADFSFYINRNLDLAIEWGNAV